MGFKILSLSGEIIILFFITMKDTAVYQRIFSIVEHKSDWNDLTNNWFFSSFPAIDEYKPLYKALMEKTHVGST